MPDKNLIELSNMQLEEANNILKFIPSYIELGDFNGAINRSYYATFHALKALELLDGFDTKKHSGAIAYFRQHYVKTGLFDSKLSKVIGRLQEARESSDYDVIEKFDLRTAYEMYDLAKEFVNCIENYLNEKI